MEFPPVGTQQYIQTIATMEKDVNDESIRREHMAILQYLRVHVYGSNDLPYVTLLMYNTTCTTYSTKVMHFVYFIYETFYVSLIRFTIRRSC